ncbi:hypothetical protein GCM10011609_20180 [Lentzea pudingi]|uniref:DUF1653 domain-containing protein n=1 Tax=Lentzea pudingi TaxID=1789439 RepID=A0ABQ2HJY4_9PSEU|nr:hypothetical protein [Lentzea pudingi]GGM84043.1 hypothetical protein GCM10011609_20180 [Lentzea pudingi]
MAGKYRYYALIGGLDTLENPYTVVRVDGDVEESFKPTLEWSRTELMRRIRWERADYEVVKISEEDAKRFEKIQARRTEEIRERDGG